MKLTFGDRRNLTIGPSDREYGPADDPRDADTRLFVCGECGVEYAPGCWWSAHDFESCAGRGSGLREEAG